MDEPLDEGRRSSEVERGLVGADHAHLFGGLLAGDRRVLFPPYDRGTTGIETAGLPVLMITLSMTLRTTAACVSLFGSAHRLMSRSRSADVSDAAPLFIASRWRSADSTRCSSPCRAAMYSSR